MPEPCIPVSFVVGDRADFAIEGALPGVGGFGNKQAGETANDVLAITNGYLTFWAKGQNLLALDSPAKIDPTLVQFTSLPLSMVLEWIYYDRAYDLSRQVRRFSDIANGESTPNLDFDVFGHEMVIRWDFKDVTRCGCPYKSVSGTARTNAITFLVCLATLADVLLAAIRWRSTYVGNSGTWLRWLAGYKAEQIAFSEYISTTLNT